MKKNALLGVLLVFTLFCAVSRAEVRVIEFTMNDCPACVSALADVGTLLENGVFIEARNTSTDVEGAKEAQRLNATKRPTFIVFDDSREIARFEGAGHAADIIAAYNAAKTQKNTPTTRPTVNQEPQEELELPADVMPVINEDLTLPREDELSPQTDFRRRPRVVDQFTRAGFLDKSREFWNERRADDEPKQAPEPEIEPERDARLGDRFSGKILEGTNGKIDEIKQEALRKLDQIGADAKNALQTQVAREFESTRGEIKNQIDNVKKDVLSAFFNKIEEKINEAKNSFYMLAICGALAFLLWRAFRKAK